MEKHKEETRDARGVSWLETLRRRPPLRRARAGQAPRLRRRSPSLTLGLGIGANTAIFSVINGVLLKPLPYEHGDRLVLVQQSAPLVGPAARRRLDRGVLRLSRAGTDVFDGLVEYHQMNFDLLNRGEPDRVNTGVVSHNFFDLLGIKPHHRPHLRRRRR